MRLRNRNSSLLLLLVPSLALATVADRQLEKDSVIADGPSSGRRFGNRDAPVDGLDGKPHAGPFVELNTLPTDSSDLPTLKDRPADPTIVDGKRIPESHDGVMDDKNRAGPKKGTTGTEGGVSEKETERRLREEQTGEKAENKPQTPKEVPPLPHSDQAGEGKYGDKTSDDVTGLEVGTLAKAVGASGID